MKKLKKLVVGAHPICGNATPEEVAVRLRCGDVKLARTAKTAQ